MHTVDNVMPGRAGGDAGGEFQELHPLSKNSLMLDNVDFTPDVFLLSY